MKIVSKVEAEMSKFDLYRPFPKSVRLTEAKNVVNVERSLEVTCMQSLAGITRATIELEQFKKALENGTKKMF